MSTQVSPEFSERLKWSRERRELTQDGLTKLANLPKGTISHFEVGSRKPSFDNLRLLADALGVTTDFLLGRVDEPGGVGQDAQKLFRHWDELSNEDQEIASSLVESLAQRRKAKQEAGES